MSGIELDLILFSYIVQSMKTIAIIDSIWRDLSKRTEGFINVLIMAPFVILCSFFCSELLYDRFFYSFIGCMAILLLWLSCLYQVDWGKRRNIFEYFSQHKETVEKETEERIEKRHKETEARFEELAREIELMKSKAQL